MTRLSTLESAHLNAISCSFLRRKQVKNFFFHNPFWCLFRARLPSTSGACDDAKPAPGAGFERIIANIFR
jgi:hypothetical protein